ncbi:stromal cell-derived factor 2 precursor-like protein [Schistosoma mansoni]|nr:stromal cell-derived factor 2 precursor-like protein [Schistosoma mansoni]|eukprot:XP_018649643.1 stromal cell-derived factor 2 precursor-like protein [Schistosoma mansoni]
MMTVKIFPS